VFKSLYSLNCFYSRIEGLNNQALKDLSIKQSDKKIDDSASATGYEDSPLDYDNVHVKLLRDTVKRTVHKHIDSRLVEGEIWAHVLKTGETTMIHSHRNKSDWGFLGVSWVYYVQNPTTKNSGGKIVFQTQIGGTKTINADFDPKDGDLIIFPGWLPHFTTRNNSPDVRISISGNYRIQRENEHRYNDIANDPNSGIKKLTGF
jgi:hypothetical protein